ncbi:hypothetical protein HWB05_gp183 [Streptomyces phage BRock]|uniref:Uncharacterized protein n=1 Tax=Streptomyces phage BRock TaxID=1913591 RepID=A0A6C1FJ77_9CAUD|nr:hypothetical protein HWB05_gp183 [Streptomyces phage BRock]QIE02564.1 hypothetical protein [Streptomyces phage BRock]
MVGGTGKHKALRGYASVAQWKEQQPSKLTVAGSNPAGGTQVI